MKEVNLNLHHFGKRAAAFGAKTDFATGNQPRSVALGDVNEDGKLDIVVGNFNVNTVSVLLGTGTGSFGPKTDFATGNVPLSVELGDVNGDGKLDIVTANSGDSTTSVLLGVGNGSFGGKTDFAAGNSYSTLADVNGDGKLDIISSGSNIPGAVSVLLGTGTGTFGPKTDYTTANLPNAVAVGDVNGDGKLDIVTCGGAAATARASVLLGTGTGSFGANTDYIGDGDPSSVALADINGDGSLDILIANYSVATVSVFLNTGAGNFAAKTDYISGLSPRSGKLVDVDGDGKLDIVTANGGSNDISILLGTGTGSFGAKTDFVTGTQPYAVALADVNGDGSPDIVTANYGADTVSILLNQVIFPSPTPSQSPSSSLTASNSATVSNSAAVSPSISGSSSSCATAVIESVINKVTIKDGQTIVYSAAKNLQADLPGCTPNEISYTVEEVTHGQFERTKGKVVVRDKNEITSFTQAEVDAGAISFAHDGSNKAPTYTLEITNGVVRESDEGDVTFIPRKEASKKPDRTSKPTSKPSSKPSVSSASSLSAMPDVSTSLMLGMVLAKMGSNALSSVVSAGKSWWQGESKAVSEVSVAESKQAYACFERLQTRVEQLLSQTSTALWYRYGLEDIKDELNNTDINSLTLAQVKEWQAELGELEAEYMPSIANQAASMRTRSNSFFKPIVQSVVMPEQPAALPAMAQRHIAV